MRQKRVTFDAHKQLWCWVLLPQIDSLLYLLWKMHLLNLKDQLLFSLMVRRQKWKEKSARIKKTITATTVCVVNHISIVLVLFESAQHYLRHG